MSRVTPSITRAAIRLVSKTRQSNLALDEGLTNWEGEFLDGLEERLQKYGSAFNDPDLGATCGALSLRQGLKLKQIKQKAQPKKAVKALLPKTGASKLKSAKPMKRSPLKRKSPNFVNAVKQGQNT